MKEYKWAESEVLYMMAGHIKVTTTFGSLCWEEMKEYKWAESEVLYMMIASFPGSSAPEREIEFIHAERAWYFFSRENPQR